MRRCSRVRVSICGYNPPSMSEVKAIRKVLGSRWCPTRSVKITCKSTEDVSLTAEHLRTPSASPRISGDTTDFSACQRRSFPLMLCIGAP